MTILFVWLALSTGQTGLPKLERIFLDEDRAAFSQLLSSQVRVKTDLRPILHDYGNLSSAQVLMGFDKLFDRFEPVAAEVVNFQSDTNYSWLELYLNIRLKDKRTERVYEAAFAFHFKITASKMAVNRWVLQDIH